MSAPGCRPAQPLGLLAPGPAASQAVFLPSGTKSPWRPDLPSLPLHSPAAPHVQVRDEHAGSQGWLSVRPPCMGKGGGPPTTAQGQSRALEGTKYAERLGATEEEKRGGRRAQWAHRSPDTWGFPGQGQTLSIKEATTISLRIQNPTSCLRGYSPQRREGEGCLGRVGTQGNTVLCESPSQSQQRAQTP